MKWVIYFCESVCVFNLKGGLAYFHKGNLNIENKQLWGEHDTEYCCHHTFTYTVLLTGL